jgi:translation elongation factor EF-Ts
VQVVNAEDVTDAMLAKERALEMQREDLQSKPENIRAKIVDGRIEKLRSQQARRPLALLQRQHAVSVSTRCTRSAAWWHLVLGLCLGKLLAWRMARAW